MFKVILSGVPSPRYLLFCDDRHCSISAMADANLSSADDQRLSEAQFLSGARKEGWLVQLDQQLCPGHTKVLMETMAKMREEKGKVVRVAEPFEEVRFGKPARALRVVDQGENGSGVGNAGSKG